MIKLTTTYLEGIWKTDKESISYSRKVSVLIQDDENWLRYFFQITKWPVNTTVEVLVVCGGAGFLGSEGRWLIDRSHKVGKFPNTECDQQREKLILPLLIKALKWAQLDRKKLLSL